MTIEKQYGFAEVCEYRIPIAVIRQIVFDHLAENTDPSYNFDRSNPVAIITPREWVVRFLTTEMTNNSAKSIVHHRKPATSKPATTTDEKGE